MRVFSLDREAVLAWLRRWASALGRSREEVRRVVLFGSLARGDHRARSDADLLIELDVSDRSRWFDRIPDYLPGASPVPTDVFPYTSEEIRRMRDGGNRLVRRALEEGVILFERGAPRPT